MSVSQRVLKGSGLLLAIQLVQRSLGLLSTLILARLLAPEHFGIIALVAIALHFFEVLADAGNKNYIIQKADVTDDDLNTAWTLDILIKSIMAAAIFASAPALASYFEAPDLTAALRVACLALPLRALKSPGLMLLAKHINYRPVFFLNVSQKLISFATVITIALIHPSFWAIIVGDLVAAVVMTVGSYWAHTHRPRLSLKQVMEQWNFSKWIILRGLVGFTRSHIDNLFVSKLFGPTQLGGYHLVRELSTFPAISVIIPGSEPLQAAIADGKSDPAVLAYRIRLSLFLMTTLLLPISGFMAQYPELITRVLLGPDWTEYGHLLAAFSLFFFTFCLFALVVDAFLAIGQVRTLFLFDAVSTVIIVGALWALTEPSLTMMAWARGGLAILTTIALMVILNLRVHFGLTQYLILCLPCTVATAAGLAVDWLIDPALPDHPLVQLILLGSAFLAVWSLVFFGLLRLYVGRYNECRHLITLVMSVLKIAARFLPTGVSRNT